MEENSEIQEDLGSGGKVKNWLQDNIRVILSVLIVATIMAGIYSYSKRTVVPVETTNSNAEINLAKADVKEDNNAVVVVGEDVESNKVEKTEEASSEKLSVGQEDEESSKLEAEKAEEAKVQAEAVAKKQAEEAEKAEEAKNVENSNKETKEFFSEKALAGDSLTILARRATRQYLEENSTKGLNAEHKVYIEDYLRKQIKHSASINMGEEVSFSKDLIAQAISLSKNLNEGQLKNLQRYSARVSNL